MTNQELPTALAQARQDIVRLFDLEGEMTATWQARLATIAGVEKEAGEKFLDNPSAGIEAAAQAIVNARTEGALLGHAIQTARRRRLAAIRKRFQVEAAELRTAARVRSEESADILRRAIPFLAKLAALEGVTYDTSILLAQRTGTWGHDIITGRPLEDCSPREATPDLDAGFAVPRSRILRDEATQLEKRATELEAREPAQDGELAKSSLEDLLGELRQDPESIMPTISAVETWAASCESQIQDSGLGGDWPRVYRLAWKGGEIDLGVSNITVRTDNYNSNPPVFFAKAA